jgi:hypothetical protein
MNNVPDTTYYYGKQSEMLVCILYKYYIPQYVYEVSLYTNSKFSVVYSQHVYKFNLIGTLQLGLKSSGARDPIWS